MKYGICVACYFLHSWLFAEKIHFSDELQLLKRLYVLEEMDLSTLILLRIVESLASCIDKHSAVGSDIDLNQTWVFEFD